MARGLRGFVTTSVVALSLVAASGWSTRADPESLTLANHYTATGTNPDGSSYSGTVDVDILSNTTFAIKWTIGSATYKGFGMRRNDALSATYMIDGEPGLVIYQVQGNGLDGIWAVRGKDGSGTEHLTPAE